MVVRSQTKIQARIFPNRLGNQDLAPRAGPFLTRDQDRLPFEERFGYCREETLIREQDLARTRRKHSITTRPERHPGSRSDEGTGLLEYR
jgi:hypothetical protein